MIERTDRRTLLADAAIELLAEHGMRGLTHRAVDARAGIPLGSTSAYLRTRSALIDAVVRRLVELDRVDIAAGHLDPADLSVDPGAWAAAFAGLLDHWLSSGRTRTLARYYCLLEATHRPELRAVLDHGRAFRVEAGQLLELLGAPDPRRAGRDLVAFLDGLLFDRIAGAGSLTAPAAGTPESRAELTEAVHAALQGLLRR